MKGAAEASLRMGFVGERSLCVLKWVRRMSGWESWVMRPVIVPLVES